MNGLITLCIPVQPTEPHRSVTIFLLKKSRKFISWLLIATMGSSCCTTALWDATDPNETIEVPPDEMTAAALIEDGFIFHQDEVSGYFHIEKTPGEKAGDYALRVVGTPVAVGTDVLLAGAVTMAVAYGTMYGMLDPASMYSMLDPDQTDRRYSNL
jgi:hypothetical protein